MQTAPIHSDAPAMLAAIRAAAIDAPEAHAYVCAWHPGHPGKFTTGKETELAHAERQRVTHRCRTPEGTLFAVACDWTAPALRALADRLQAAARHFGIKRPKPATRTLRTGRGFSVACQLLIDRDREGALAAIESGPGARAHMGRGGGNDALPYALAETITGPDGDTWHIARRVHVETRGRCWVILHDRSGLTAGGAYSSSADALAAFELAQHDASEQGYVQRWASGAMAAPTWPQNEARAAFIDGRTVDASALVPVAAPAHDQAAAPDKAPQRARMATRDERRALRLHGRQPVDMDHASAMMADGWRVFRAHDMDGAPQRVATLADLSGYCADQCIALPPDPPPRLTEHDHARAHRIACGLLASIGAACHQANDWQAAARLCDSEARRLAASNAPGARAAAELMRQAAAEHRARFGTEAPARKGAPWRGDRRRADAVGPPRDRAQLAALQCVRAGHQARAHHWPLPIVSRRSARRPPRDAIAHASGRAPPSRRRAGHGASAWPASPRPPPPAVETPTPAPWKRLPPRHRGNAAHWPPPSAMEKPTRHEQ